MSAYTDFAQSFSRTWFISELTKAQPRLMTQILRHPIGPFALRYLAQVPVLPVVSEHRNLLFLCIPQGSYTATPASGRIKLPCARMRLRPVGRTLVSSRSRQTGRDGCVPEQRLHEGGAR